MLELGVPNFRYYHDYDRQFRINVCPELVGRTKFC